MDGGSSNPSSCRAQSIHQLRSKRVNYLTIWDLGPIEGTDYAAKDRNVVCLQCAVQLIQNCDVVRCKIDSRHPFQLAYGC